MRHINVRSGETHELLWLLELVLGHRGGEVEVRKWLTEPVLSQQEVRRYLPFTLHAGNKTE